jgi:hypothetical protein
VGPVPFQPRLATVQAEGATRGMSEGLNTARALTEEMNGALLASGLSEELTGEDVASESSDDEVVASESSDDESSNCIAQLLGVANSGQDASLNPVFDSKEKKIDAYIKRHPDLRRGYIGEPRIVAWLNVLLWNHPLSVRSLKYASGDGWMGQVWTSRGGLEEVELEDGYVEDFLLSPFYKGMFLESDDDYCILTKYCRQPTINKTRFQKIIYHDENCTSFPSPTIAHAASDYGGCFRVIDCTGMPAFVTPSWVRRFIPRETILAAKAVPGKEVVVRVGSAPSLPQMENLVLHSAPSLPQMKYKNNSGRPRCVIKCLASALHYIGHAEEAANLVVNYEKISHTHHRRGELAHLREAVALTMNKRVPMRKGMHNLSSLVSTTATGVNPNPIVASLKAACFEGGRKRAVHVNHSVCFLGEFVFDSNCATALKINKENLDRICSDIVEGSFYDGIYWSRELILHR